MVETAAERSRKCRAHAEECRVQAEFAHDPSIRATFLKTAEEWKRIAIEIEEIERLGEYTGNKSRLVPPPGRDTLD